MNVYTDMIKVWLCAAYKPKIEWSLTLKSLFLFRPVSPVYGFSMFICHRDVVATPKLRCHVLGVENLLQIMELIINGKW